MPCLSAARSRNWPQNDAGISVSRTLELLERLIAFPTVSDRSNLDLIDWAQDLLVRAGFDVSRIEGADPQKAGLFATIGPRVAGGICLSAHSDVVPTVGQKWTREPFKLTSGQTRVYGRGVTDMKGFLACALALVENAPGQTLQHPLSLVLSYDEEVGCVGIRDMLPTLAPIIGQQRLVIVGEPTSMQVATGHKGKVAMKVSCTGEAGHSALAPKFVNAIHVAAGFVDEMRGLQAELAEGPQDLDFDVPYATVHVGKIEGGRALNIVPDKATLEMEFRHLAETPAAELMPLIEAAGRRVAEKAGLPGAVKIEQTNGYPGLAVLEGNPSIKQARGLTGGTTTTKVAFGTEAGYFASLGLDTLVVGPGDMASDGHKPDEGLDLSQIAACEVMMDRVLAELSGG